MKTKYFNLVFEAKTTFDNDLMHIAGCSRPVFECDIFMLIRRPRIEYVNIPYDDNITYMRFFGQTTTDDQA